MVLPSYRSPNKPDVSFGLDRSDGLAAGLVAASRMGRDGGRDLDGTAVRIAPRLDLTGQIARVFEIPGKRQGPIAPGGTLGLVAYGTTPAANGHRTFERCSLPGIGVRKARHDGERRGLTEPELVALL